MKVFLNYQKRQTHYEDTSIPGEPYSGFCTEEYEISNVELSVSKDDADYYDGLFIPPLSGEVWYAYALYSTGSTFNTTSGNVEFLFVCKSKEDAEKARDILYTTKEFSETVVLDGVEKEIYVPWAGYFESLDSLHLEKGFLPSLSGEN